MAYLDYASSTPVNEEVLQTFMTTTREYPGNPNAAHTPGFQAKARIDEATVGIAKLLQIRSDEIIYTSGASESNNLAIQGIAGKYKHGRHMITTYLEHSSVNGAIASLERRGYEIDYVDIGADGIVDLDHLESLIRKDTLLVSISHVDSELGIIQPVAEIGELVSRQQNCFFLADATQSVGKIPVNPYWADLMTFSPHKFYGLKGSGLFIKKEPVLLEPMHYGGISTTPYRSGTPAPGLICAAEKALSLAISDMDKNYTHVSALNQMLRKALADFPKIHINSTHQSVPHIVNFSVPGMKIEPFLQFMNEHAVYLSSKSSCCAVNTPSRPVYAITKDRKTALSTIRVSLGIMTLPWEIDAFLEHFSAYYNTVMKG